VWQNRPTANYNNVMAEASCTANCSGAITAMREMAEWALSNGDMSELGQLLFAWPPQPPTYYASSGCLGANGTFTLLAKKGWRSKLTHGKSN
jgi:hypothetical protein